MHLKHFPLFLLLLLATACGRHSDSAEQEPAAIDTIPLMVTQIQRCSRLYTSEYQLHKIITFDDSMSLGGTFLKKSFRINLPMGRRRVAIPMTAQVKAYVDLSKFSEKSIRRQAGKIEITLPDPQIVMTGTQVDHEHIRKKVSLFRHNFTDEEMTHVQQLGRQEIIRSLPRLGIIENARQSAARQLIPIITQLGYPEDQITITFRKQFTFGDIPALIRQTD